MTHPWLEDAKRMRADMSIRQIARKFGVTESTVYYALDPNACERHRERVRKSRAKYKEEFASVHHTAPIERRQIKEPGPVNVSRQQAINELAKRLVDDEFDRIEFNHRLRQIYEVRA